MVGREGERDAARDAAAIFCLLESLVSGLISIFPPNFFSTRFLCLSTHPVWNWLIISTGISCVAHQGWKHFNLRGKTNSRGWQISMSRWQLLPVISFNYHIISFYRRGAGCRAANEGARSHAELRAFLNWCQQLKGVRASVSGAARRVRETVWRVHICRSFHLATWTDLLLMSRWLITVTFCLALVRARNWSHWNVFQFEKKKCMFDLEGE